MDTAYLRRQLELARRYCEAGNKALALDCLSRATDALDSLDDAVERDKELLRELGAEE